MCLFLPLLRFGQQRISTPKKRKKEAGGRYVARESPRMGVQRPAMTGQPRLVDYLLAPIRYSITNQVTLFGAVSSGSSTLYCRWSL